MSKCVLVTGGAGFVGANLVRRLLGDGHDVHLIVRKGHDRWRLRSVEEHLRFHEVTLEDAVALKTLVASVRPDWIFHLAAHGGYSWQSDVGRTLESNVIGTANLLQAAVSIGVESFTNAGSSSEYGDKDHAPREDEILDPNSYYAIGKAAGTALCRLVARTHQLPISTLRLYSVYGPFEEPARLFPRLAVLGMAGHLPPLVNPSTMRDFVYVEDVVDAFVLSASTPITELGAVFNIGTGQQTSLGELVEVVRAELNITEEPRWNTMAQRSWDTNVWVADVGKAKDVLGWTATTGVREGFSRFVEWFSANPETLTRYERSADGDPR